MNGIWVPGRGGVRTFRRTPTPVPPGCCRCGHKRRRRPNPKPALAVLTPLAVATFLDAALAQNA